MSRLKLLCIGWWLCATMALHAQPTLPAKEPIQEINHWLDHASALCAKQQWDQALIPANDAYKAASKLSRKMDIARASLLLAEIYREKEIYENALEFGLRCAHISKGISQEYTLAAQLSLIHLFHDWGAWEKELEYINETLLSHSTDNSLYLQLNGAKARCLMRLGNTSEAEALIDQLIVSYQSDGNYPLWKSYILLMCDAQRDREKPESAIRYLKQLYESERKRGTADSELALIENNLGDLYLQANQKEAAFATLSAAQRHYTSNDQRKLEIMLNFAVACILNKDVQRAQTLTDEILNQAIPQNAQDIIGSTYVLISKMQAQQGDINSAIHACQMALVAAESIKDYGLVHNISQQLALLYGRSGNAALASESNTRAADAWKLLLKNKEEQSRVHTIHISAVHNRERLVLGSLDAAEEENKRLEEELRFTKREKELSELKFQNELQEAELEREAVAREKATKELALVQAALMTEQQQRTITELERKRTEEQLQINELNYSQEEKQRSLALLQKQNELLKTDSEKQSLEKQKETQSKIAALIVVSLLVIICALAIYGLMSTRKKNKVIHTNNEAIKVINQRLKYQNEEITSSISYARNFQEMIIPRDEQFTNALPNSFVYYEPLDIVSGDIPFLLESGDKVYLGAIDCIGHGVPAAMLSFMAYYNLSQLIANQPKANCGQLLEQLHDQLHSALRARDANPNFAAGIDIALCCYDRDQLSLEFAGANQPLVLVRNGIAERIQGNRFSVGDVHLKEKPTCIVHKFNLQRNDRFYLLSDGFIHQFGGPEGKQKFSMKRLMHQLQELHSIEFKDMQQQLMRSFGEWKGAYSQTDDVMLLGIEV